MRLVSLSDTHPTKRFVGWRAWLLALLIPFLHSGSWSVPPAAAQTVREPTAAELMKIERYKEREQRARMNAEIVDRRWRTDRYVACLRWQASTLDDDRSDATTIGAAIEGMCRPFGGPFIDGATAVVLQERAKRRAAR